MGGKSDGSVEFPFLLGRAFIEAARYTPGRSLSSTFPFLLGRAFIEAHRTHRPDMVVIISLPSGKGFH